VGRNERAGVVTCQLVEGVCQARGMLTTTDILTQDALTVHPPHSSQEHSWRHARKNGRTGKQLNYLSLYPRHPTGSIPDCRPCTVPNYLAAPSLAHPLHLPTPSLFPPLTMASSPPCTTKLAWLPPNALRTTYRPWRPSLASYSTLQAVGSRAARSGAPAAACGPQLLLLPAAGGAGEAVLPPAAEGGAGGGVPGGPGVLAGWGAKPQPTPAAAAAAGCSCCAAVPQGPACCGVSASPRFHRWTRWVDRLTRRWVESGDSARLVRAPLSCRVASAWSDNLRGRGWEEGTSAQAM
jgi:hypothetical protein